jgi:hypothetical protein
MAFYLEKVCIDAFFRRKCDVLVHITDLKDAGTDLEKFFKAMAITLTVLNSRAVWPLMFIKTFQLACLWKFGEQYWEDSRLLLLAWLFLTEPVPSEWQRGGKWPLSLDDVRIVFRRRPDFAREPQNQIAGRVKLKVYFPEASDHK